MPLKTVVFGAGHMGALHAAKLAAMPEVSLAGIADVDRARAEALAQRFGSRPYAEWRQALDGAEAAIVAVPTEQHAEVLEACLARGIHVLVEKPITHDLESAAAAIALARRRGVVLQVAHIERFNASFRSLEARIDRPLFIDSERLAGFHPRAATIDVILDLMIHDIDLSLVLVGAEATAVSACGFGVLTPGIDIANAYIEFANGCVANLSASRVSQAPVRKLRVFQRDLYASADLHAKRLRYVAQIEGRIDQRDESHEGGDALAEQDRAFVAAARGEAPVAVSGEDGRRALALALKVQAQVRDRLSRISAGSA